MPIIYLKVIMAVLVLALCGIGYLGQRALRGLPSLPRLRPPVLHPWLAVVRLGRLGARPATQGAQRARRLAASRLDGEAGVEAAAGRETFLDETMRSLEQAFDSFEAGRIGAETYRSVLHAEKRAAARRRAGLAARDKKIGPDAEVAAGELAEAIAAVDAVEWCLSWLDEFERPRETA